MEASSHGCELISSKLLFQMCGMHIYVYKIWLEFIINCITSSVVVSLLKLCFSHVAHRLPRDNERVWQQQTQLKSTDRNTCLGTTCHGSVWSVASCSQIGIYSLCLLIDFCSGGCSLSRRLSLGNRCVHCTLAGSEYALFATASPWWQKNTPWWFMRNVLRPPPGTTPPVVKKTSSE